MKTTVKVPATPQRSLSEIAREIRNDWRKQTKNGRIPEPAEAYLGPMSTMNKITDAYGMDSGTMIVAYFLSNASTWRGETAKRVKAELNKMLKTR